MSGKRERPARAKHDASYKSFFARRRTVADTLRAFAADLAGHLDFATLERMPASFVTHALGQRHADMLWRIRTTGGRSLYILILIEFQSTVDRRMALRMMEYAAAIWMRLELDDLGPGANTRLCCRSSSTTAGGAGPRQPMWASYWPRCRRN